MEKARAGKRRGKGGRKQKQEKRQNPRHTTTGLPIKHITVFISSVRNDEDHLVILVVGVVPVGMQMAGQINSSTVYPWVVKKWELALTTQHQQHPELPDNAGFPIQKSPKAFQSCDLEDCTYIKHRWHPALETRFKNYL